MTPSADISISDDRSKVKARIAASSEVSSEPKIGVDDRDNCKRKMKMNLSSFCFKDL